MKIEFKSASKRFNDTVVLNQVSTSLDFKSLAVLGPSGSGKSTLLRLLAGLIPVDEGTILIDSKGIPNRETELIQYRQSMGFVFQSSGLFPHLSALENITLALVHVHGNSLEEANEKALNYLQKFGLSAQAHQAITTLSGGQQQRIQIIRAIIHKPKVILLDEPTSALDPDISVDVLEMLKELIKEGIQVILVTHHLGFAKNVCDHVIFIDDHTIVESGPSKERFEKPQTESFKRFLNKMREFD